MGGRAQGPSRARSASDWQREGQSCAPDVHVCHPIPRPPLSLLQPLCFALPSLTPTPPSCPQRPRPGLQLQRVPRPQEKPPVLGLCVVHRQLRFGRRRDGRAPAEPAAAGAPFPSLPHRVPPPRRGNTPAPRARRLQLVVRAWLQPPAAQPLHRPGPSLSCNAPPPPHAHPPSRPPQGYEYAMFAPQPNGSTFEFARSAHPPQPPPDSVAAMVHVPNSEWTLLVRPSQGWVPSWRDPMLAATTIASALIGLLVCAVLVSRRQQTWLLSEMRVGATTTPFFRSCGGRRGSGWGGGEA